MDYQVLGAARTVLTPRPVRIGLVFALAAIFAGSAHAQPAPRKMSLREAIAYARAHQPSLAAARARVEVAREEAQLPRAARETPRIVAGAEVVVGSNNNSTASYGGPLGFDIARIGGTPAYTDESWTPYGSTLVGAGLRQEIYDFGRLAAQAEALDLFARAASEDAALADLDLVLLVEESFYAVDGAHAVQRAAEAAVQRSTAHRDLAKAGVDAKLRPPVDLTRAEADLARFEVDRIRAVGAVTTSQAVLAAAIGAPDAAIDTGADDVSYTSALPIDSLMRELDQREPSLRAARDSLNAQQALTRSIERELAPDIELSADITGRAGGATVTTAGASNPAGAGFIPSLPNYNGMVVLSWPVFDRTVNVRAATSRRVERVRAAELDAERERLRGVATQAYVDLQVAQSALPALQRSLDAARANEGQVDARFKAGLSTAVELA
ncbi:MAG TPA: TolC family protein, partial [Kofleriaceae bacterium]|nr:TolC family protein [Kofleriaceae bacterium]